MPTSLILVDISESLKVASACGSDIIEWLDALQCQCEYSNVKLIHGFPL